MIEYTVYWEHFDPITSTSHISELEVDEGAITLRRFDEALDTALVVIPFTKRKGEYNRLDNVTIQMTQGDLTKYFYYCIAQDSVEITSKQPLLYKHTLSLVERTKKLERFLASTLTFTQPTDGTIRYTLLNVIERINETTPFERTSLKNSTRTMVIPSSLNFLDTIEAPQLFLTQMTMREALNTVGQVINAIPRLENNDNLSFDYFNYLETLLTNVEGISFASTNDIDYYATSIESYTRNAVMEDNEEQAQMFYPSKTEFLHISGNVLADTQQAYFSSEYNINQMLKVTMPIRVIYNYFIGELPQTVDRLIELDISKYVMEKKLWDLLTDEVPTGDMITKRNAMYFEKGSNKIQEPLKSYGDPLFDWQTSVYARIGNTAYAEWEDFFLAYDVVLDQPINKVYDIFGNELPNNGGISGPTPTFPDNMLGSIAGTYNLAVIRIEYIPQIDTRLRMEREDIIEINKDTHLLTNQEDRVISLDYYIQNLRGQIQRIGNDNITMAFITQRLSEVIDMGDYFIIEDGKPDYYVCVISEITAYNDHILNRCEFTKNFNRISEYVGLNNEVRQYEIPSDDKTYERNVHYTEYVELNDYEMFDVVGVFSTPLGKNTFMNTLDYDIDYDKPITSARFRPITNAGQVIMTPVSANGDENTLIFTLGFKSNQLAGYQLIASDYFLDLILPIQTPIRYTEDDGSLDEFEFELGYDFPRTTIAPNNGLTLLEMLLEDAMFLPLTVGFNDNAKMISSDSLFVWKDPSEILKMTYQLQILPSRENYGRFIVGRYLARNNNLVNVYSTNNVIKNGLKVYGHADAFGKFENQKYKVGSVDLSANVSIGIEYATGLRQPRLYLTDATDVLANYKSWAICDSLGRLYLAVNQDDTTGGYIPKKEIYFNFLNKRRGIILGNNY